MSAGEGSGAELRRELAKTKAALEQAQRALGLSESGQKQQLRRLEEVSAERQALRRKVGALEAARQALSSELYQAQASLNRQRDEARSRENELRERLEAVVEARATLEAKVGKLERSLGASETLRKDLSDRAGRSRGKPDPLATRFANLEELRSGLPAAPGEPTAAPVGAGEGESAVDSESSAASAPSLSEPLPAAGGAEPRDAGAGAGLGGHPAGEGSAAGAGSLPVAGFASARRLVRPRRLAFAGLVVATLGILLLWRVLGGRPVEVEVSQGSSPPAVAAVTPPADIPTPTAAAPQSAVETAAAEKPEEDAAVASSEPGAGLDVAAAGAAASAARRDSDDAGSGSASAGREPAPSEGDPLPSTSVAGPDPAVAEEAVRAWAAAWSDRRVDDYLAGYSRLFVPPKGASRAAWEATRRQRILKPRRIAVRLSGLERLELEPGKVRVRFFQDYESDTFRDRVRKTLILAWESGAWRIVEERASS